MEFVEERFQRRAVVGGRHFILANPEQPDVWALAGPVVTAVDENGVRSFGPAKTITTQALMAWALRKRLAFRIEEQFPLAHRDISVAMAA